MSWAWFWFIMFICVCSMLQGCITVPDNPCSMANMTASELEYSLVHGCQQ